MGMCPVRKCGSLLNVFLLKSLSNWWDLVWEGSYLQGGIPIQVMWHGCSSDGSILQAFLLWRDAMNAWVLWLCWSGLSFTPSLASQSASSLPTMLECLGTQLMAISTSFTSSRIPLMCLLKVRDCFWAFPGDPL